MHVKWYQKHSLLNFALKIWLKSPSGYKEMANTFRLPSMRTLQRLRSRMDKGPGWHAEVIMEMKYGCIAHDA